MARGIYEITLKENFFPELNERDALDTFNMDGGVAGLREDDVEIRRVVEEEHTMELFLLAKTMYDMEKFTEPEIEAVVRALAIEMGYHTIYKEVAACVIKWTERMTEDMTLHDMEEWLIG